MTHHVQMPRLCVDCETTAQALAETSPPNDRVIKRCQHGPEGVVVAVALKRGAAILKWQIEGPMTEEEADLLGARMALAALDAGMKIHEVTRQ